MHWSVGNIILALERSRVTFGQLVGAFLGFVFVRTFLEVVVGVGKMTSLVAMGIHYPLFYLSLLLTLAIILRVFSGEDMAKVVRALVPCYGIIILPPVVDLILFGAGGFKPKYLFFSRVPFREILTMFATFFSRSAPNTGITVGMRIEIALGIVGVALYVWLKTRKFWRALAAALVTYVLIFCYVSQPIFFRFAKQVAVYLGFVRPGSLGWSQFWVLIITLQFPFVLLAWNRKKFSAVVRNIRPFRVVHYILMFLLGLWVGIKGRVDLLPELNLYDLVFSALAVFFAWEFCVVVNDLADEGIDVHANPRRPLTSGALSRTEMYFLGGFYLLFAVLSAALTNQRLAFMILAFVAAYWIYSVPPARLKRFPLVSTALISVACLSIIYGGIIIAGRQPLALPPKFALAIFVVFTLAFNAKDLKDYEGDRAGNIKTIMTIFGPVKGRRIISILVVISYLIFPMILGVWSAKLIALSLLFGILTGLIIMLNVREWAIFLIYFAYFALLYALFGGMLKNVLLA